MADTVAVSMPQPAAARDLTLADSHVHLDRYTDEEVTAIITRATAAGVVLMVTVGCNAASATRAVALAQQHATVEAAVGLHPLWLPATAAELSHELEQVRALARDTGRAVRAIGEIGLDAGQERVPLDQQRAAFAAQLAIAVEVELPVIVHSVGTHRQTAALLAQPELKSGLPGVIIHYFIGDEEALRRYLRLDCYISFGRALLKPGSADLRALARIVPAERLLVETDTYPLPGRTTEPRDVAAVVWLLAALRGEDVASVAACTARNLRRLLGLP